MITVIPSDVALDTYGNCYYGRCSRDCPFVLYYVTVRSGIPSIYLNKGDVPVADPEFFNIGIKHGFSCINICQVPWEVLKTKAEGRGFQHLPRDLANFNALKNHVQSLLLHKNWKHCYISCTILFRLFTHVSRTQFPRTMLVLGLGSTHLVTAANLWPRYDHIESCVPVH